MDINQDNLIEKIQLLRLLIQKGRFEAGVRDDVDELDEFVDGESMGILALVDNKEARCILKEYGENNLVSRSFLEKYILNHCIDDTSITGITKLTILNLTIGCVQKNVIFRVVEKENPFYDISLNFKTQRELGIIIDPSDNLILSKHGTFEFRVVAELEKLSILNKKINKNESILNKKINKNEENSSNNTNNNNNIYNNNNNNNNKINNTKNNLVDDIVNMEQNKLNVLKMDNFSENNKIGNINNGKCETKNNILITKEENKNNFTGNANFKKYQNNNIEINSTVKINTKATSTEENINSNNKNILEDSENINNQGNSNKIVKEEININESIKVDSINNKTNNSITSSLVKESNVNDNKSLEINTIQITSFDNKNEQFTKNEFLINYNVNIKEKKIDNNISPINEHNKMVKVDSIKEIKIKKIKNIIKIPYISIKNNDKNKINTNKFMMLKPEIVLKEIISYNNNRVDTKRIIRNYRYKRK